MVLTRKTRKAEASVRFGGLDGGGNGVLKTVNSTNFYCDNGVLKTACTIPMQLDNGKTANCTLSGLIAVHRLGIYNQTEKTYATQYCVTTEAGTAQLQLLPEENSYTFLLKDIGKGELITFIDSDLCYRGGVFGTQSCALFDAQKVVTKLDLGKPSGAGCYYKHRLFVAVKPSTLRYSAIDDVTDFEHSLREGGEISFPNAGGEIVAMRPFKGYLYLFFEYGIMRLKINGLPTEFAAEKVEYKGGKIFGRTVCVGEHAIIFMSNDGLQRLDTRGVEEICRGVIKLPYGETRAEGAAVWKNKAFIRYQTGNGVYETICVNEDGKRCLYLDDMQALSQEEGGMALFRGKLFTFFRLSEEGQLFNGKAFLQTSETDFGISKRKTLTKLKVAGRGDCYITICNGGKKSRKYLYFNDGYSEIRINERGEKFSFYIEADTCAQIGEITVEMRVPA